jgi:hypothetical protein
MQKAKGKRQQSRSMGFSPPLRRAYSGEQNA